MKLNLLLVIIVVVALLGLILLAENLKLVSEIEREEQRSEQISNFYK